MSCTYVYDGIEVELTGRTAVRKNTNIKVIVASTEQQQTLHEITPFDTNVHGDWKKWVPMSTLYIIEEN